MDGHPVPVRVALVDLDWRDLDRFRGLLAAALRDAGSDEHSAADADVRLVVAQGPESPAFQWARLAGVPRTGEVARLGEVVVDTVIVNSGSPRAGQAARLAASLGALVVALPRPEASRAGAAS